LRRTGRKLRRHWGIVATFMLMAAFAGVVAAFGWFRPATSDDETLQNVPKQTVQLKKNPPAPPGPFVPLSEYGEPQPKRVVLPGRKTPLTVELTPGEYLVVAEVPGFGFHEVYRTVPNPGQPQVGFAAHRKWTEPPGGDIELPTVKIFP